MPDEAATPTHLLTTEAIRWGIETLGSQRIDPAFVFYLYLRFANKCGELASATASSQFLDDLLRVPGGPPNKPFYRPLRERGQRGVGLLRTFWLQPNLAGSWSPASLGRLRRAKWMVSESGQYLLPSDHASLAKENLLFGKSVSALALASFFLRNDGFILECSGHAEDLIQALQEKFDYSGDLEEFDLLFDGAFPQVTFEWFVPTPRNEDHYV